MDIYDNKNKFLKNIFTLDDKPNYQLVKDVVFVETKNYKYNPSFSRVYFVSPDLKQANLITVFDELETGKDNLNDPGFVEYLAREYSLPKEAIHDAIQIVMNTPQKAEIIDRIMSSYPQIKQNVDTYYNVLPPPSFFSFLTGPQDTWSQGSTSPTGQSPSGQSPTSPSRSQYSPTPSSYSPTSSNFSITDLFEKLNKEIPVEKKIDFSDFYTYLRYFYIVVTKPNLLNETRYEEMFRNFVLNTNFLAVGMQLDGASKFRIAKSTDKNINRKIKIFTHSEHKITQVKTLKQNTIYFLYNISKEIHVSGELRSNMVIVLRVVFSEKFELTSMEDLESLMKIHADTIYDRFKQLMPNLIENPDRKIVKISVKLTHKKGKIDRDIIRHNFVTNFRETHKGTIMTFDLMLDSTTTLKNVIYSEKEGFSNFSLKDIPTKDFISIVINKITYPFKGNAEIKESDKKEKKKKIKDLNALGIPYDSRKCQKDRRIEVFDEETDQYENNRIMDYKGNKLVCKNPEYPYPGETKTGIPCCFKKIQVKAPVSVIKNIDVNRALAIRPLLKEKEELVQFRREGLRNRLLEDIFPIEDGFYALTLSDTKIGIEEILYMMYGNDIVQKSFASLRGEDKDYFDISGNTDITDIVKAVTLHNKINIMVVSYTDNDFKFMCSMSQFLIFDKFIVFLLYRDNYKILVKSNDTTKQIGWVINKSNQNLQRLIRAYNASCLDIKDCSHNVPDLKKILVDGVVKINYGIIDPLTNRINYLDTDVGIIPIKLSKISYSIPTKFMNEIEKIDYERQVQMLKTIEDTYPYLAPSGKVYNETKKFITGIKTSCNFLIPVKDKAEEAKVEDEIYEFDITSKLKEDVMSGEELDFFKENFVENYKETVANTVRKYYNENTAEKNIIISFIQNHQFEELLDYLNKLFVVKQIVEVPVENFTSIPIPIQEENRLEFLTHITWLLMNNSEEFFTENIVKDRAQLDLSLIPNMEEVVIEGL